MASPNISKLSYKQLIKLEADVAIALARRKQEEKTDVKRQLAELAARSGFELSDVIGKQQGRKKGSKVAVKYRHPNDPTLTWTGRGRQPLWLVAELKNGKKLGSFLIG